jgi:pimeloyl-ACP methyl ester carboxylesterase
MSARIALASVVLAGCRAAAPFRSGVEHAVSGGTIFERRLGGEPGRPTLVLLHGVPVTSSVAEPLARELRERVANSVALVDLPGLGSSTVDGEVRWSTQRSVLAAWLAEQGPVIFVVHDIAGPIALPLLADERIDVRGVVLLNTILEPSTFRPVLTMRLLGAPALGFLSAWATPRWLYLRRMKALGIAKPERVETGLLERLYAETFGSGRWRALHAVMRGFELDSAADRALAAGLAREGVPCVAVWGDADPSLGDQRSHLASLAPHCPVHVLPEARHFLMLDHASEIADALLAAGIENW